VNCHCKLEENPVGDVEPIADSGRYADALAAAPISRGVIVGQGSSGGRQVAVCRATLEPARSTAGATAHKTPRSPLEAEPFHGDARRPGDPAPALVPTSTTTQKIIVYVKTEPNHHHQPVMLRCNLLIILSRVGVKTFVA